MQIINEDNNVNKNNKWETKIIIIQIIGVLAPLYIFKESKKSKKSKSNYSEGVL